MIGALRLALLTTSFIVADAMRDAQSPVLVFLLAGQSNMQGHGYVNATENDTVAGRKKFKNGTLEWMVETYPEKYGKLKKPKKMTGSKGDDSSSSSSSSSKNSNHMSTLVIHEDDVHTAMVMTTASATTTTVGRLLRGQGMQQQQDVGEWMDRDDVWIAYNRQWIDDVRPVMNEHGLLRPGSYAGDPHTYDGSFEIGPELGFGWTVAEGTNGQAENQDRQQQMQQILLIKVAWGGRSLAVDFRPPSSGGTTGRFYTAMVEDVFLTLAKLDELFPPVNEDGGDNDYSNDGRQQKLNYKLAGLFWHQGWNDGCFDDMTDEYEKNLANLIRDVRLDLDVPDLPVVVANSGMTGFTNDEADERRRRVIDAQMSVGDPTKYPEFVGTVKSVETRPFYRPVDNSPGDQIYHWHNNCESYWLIGEASGKAMLELMKV
jgi:alpha-galactosidase